MDIGAINKGKGRTKEKERAVKERKAQKESTTVKDTKEKVTDNRAKETAT